MDSSLYRVVYECHQECDRRMAWHDMRIVIVANCSQSSNRSFASRDLQCALAFLALLPARQPAKRASARGNNIIEAIIIIISHEGIARLERPAEERCDTHRQTTVRSNLDGCSSSLRLTATTTAVGYGDRNNYSICVVDLLKNSFSKHCQLHCPSYHACPECTSLISIHAPHCWCAQCSLSRPACGVR